MSSAWWTRGRSPAQKPALDDARPRLVPGGRDGLIEDLARRIGAYVPEWRNLGPEDAGVALVRLFGEQLEPVLTRIERLPDKALVELLSSAGIALLPPRPARVLLAFTAAPTAPSSVLVPSGFRVSSPPADGSPEDVMWETERELFATPAEIAEAFVDDGATVREVDVSGAESFRPLGVDPRPGAALVLGLAVERDPGPTLALGVEPTAASGAPPPAAAGGEPTTTAPPPLLRWEALVGGRFQQLEIVIDQTDHLKTSGVVELRLPPAWSAERPSLAGDGEPRRWLRLRLVHGRFAPRLDSITLNMVSALAVHTVRDEFPRPIGGPGPKRFRLSQTPVLPGSVALFVDEGAVPVPSGGPAAPSGDENIARLFAFQESEGENDQDDDGFRRWQEVDSLIGQGPAARVFELDSTTGTIRFGDDRDGMAPPDGARNVVARAYRVGSGRAGAVEAGTITRLLTSIPFLQGVTNPRPASGGTAEETLAQAMVRGPQAIKARGRAVTAPDASLLAREAVGADVARAFALPGVDPSRPGASIPGVIGLFVVPARRPEEAGKAPPVPTSQTLHHAARHLAERVGPLGARVVAASPRFHDVRVETTVSIGPDADVGEVVTRVLQALDEYLDPLVGGEDHTGWPLGEALRHARLVRRVLEASDAVRSVPFLNVVVDGIRHAACADVPLSPTGLTWPSGHEVVPRVEEDRV